MLEEHEFESRLKWLVNLRWIGILSVLVTTHVVREIEFLTFPLLPVYSILGVASLYNLFFWWKLRAPREGYKGLAIGQILLDQFTLALAMYFSGGIGSPFVYFFIFHVVISGLLLSFRHTMAIALLAVLFPATVAGLRHFSVLPYFGIFKEEPVIFTNLTVMAGYGAAYIGTLFFTAYFTAYLSKKQFEGSVKLSTLLEASRLTTSTLELERILSESLKVVLHITKLKVGIVFLLDQKESGRCYDFFECKVFDCPAYKAEVNCWMLPDTKCPDHDTAKSFDTKVRRCASCDYFADTVLIPRMTKGFDGNGHLIERMKLNNATIKQALLTGYTIIGTGVDLPSPVPFTAVTEIAMPLLVRQQLVGVLYLASHEAQSYTEDNKAFFHLLAEVLSAGVLSGRLYEDLESSYLQTVTALSNAIEAKDPYTRGHTERVAKICLAIAEAVQLSAQEKERLQFAAILHDVGKIGISKEILGKEATLTAGEGDSVQTHPDIGVQILQPVVFLRPILSTIRHHHERFDGAGYPSGLRGKEIPYLARILGIADAWDSMLSNRPYRQALSVKEAAQELRRNAGSQFDPELVEVFLKTLA